MADNLQDVMKIHVKNDNLQCFLEMLQIDANLKKEDLELYLKENGIVFGLIEEAFEKIVNVHYSIGSKILVAEGIYPSKGKNGKIEYLISDAPQMKIDDSGRTDFYDIGLIKSIKEGQQVARVVPPEIGLSGKNILDEEVPGLLGDKFDVAMVLGKNVKLDENGEFIISNMNGCYKRSRNVINVVETLHVAGDVNFSVGNFDTYSNVEIQGDVRPKFKLKSDSNIIVNGVIEDSQLDIGDNLICRQGIAKGSAPITVGSTIRTKYVMSRSNIRCKSISVESTVFASQIIAESEIEAKKISSGTNYAKDRIVTEELGNEQHHRTVVELGMTSDDIYKMANLSNNIQKLKRELQEQVKDVSFQIGMINKSLKNKREHIISSGNKVLLTKFKVEEENKVKEINTLKSGVLELRTEIKELSVEFDALKERKENPTATVLVKKIVYPNVKIIVNTHLEYNVTKRMYGVEFRINSQGELKPFIGDEEKD